VDLAMSTPKESVRRPLIVALTGGIASGKTAASDHFARLGATIVDTDLLAREVVAPGSEGLAALVTAFGAGILAADGSLDRRGLRERVFADPAARAALEAITHPRIRALAAARARAAPDAPYVIVAIPLLRARPVPGSDYDFLDRVLVIDVPEAVQLARVMARDAIERPLAEAMLAAQPRRAERLALADDVLVNDADLAALQRGVEALDARYRLGQRRNTNSR
jgi:dephospho-CoA kinase